MEGLWLIFYLRVVLEPYNYTRRILGIEVSIDIKSDYHHRNTDYSTDDKFGNLIRLDQHRMTLDQIIALQEQENLMSNIPKAEVFYVKH